MIEPSPNVSSVSFVNSISTLRGGTHVDFVMDFLTKNISLLLQKDPSIPHVAPGILILFCFRFLD